MPRGLSSHKEPETNAQNEALVRAWQHHAKLDAAARGYRRRFLRIQFGLLAWQALSTAYLLLHPLLVSRQIVPAASPLFPAVLALLTGQPASLAPSVLGWGLYLLGLAIPNVTAVLARASSKSSARHEWALNLGCAEAIEGQIYACRVEMSRDEAAVVSAGEVSPQAALDDRVEGVLTALDKWRENASELKRLGSFPSQDRALESAPPVPAARLIPLSAQDYVPLRLDDQIVRYSRNARRLAGRYRRCWRLIVTLGGLGTLLAALGQELWIILTVVLSGALTAWLEARQTQRALVHCNQARTGLKNVREWWDALMLSDQKNAEHQHKLVAVTEKLLRSHEAGWVHEIMETMAQLDEQKGRGETQ